MAKSRKRPDGVASASDARESTPEFTPVGRSGHREAGDGHYGDRVAMRAYELYLARGASDGRDFDDWLTAEREVAGPRMSGSE